VTFSLVAFERLVATHEVNPSRPTREENRASHEVTVCSGPSAEEELMSTRPTTVTVHPPFAIDGVDPQIFGGFLEHLGRAVYRGVFEP
jgi:hypothetical protein